MTTNMNPDANVFQQLEQCLCETGSVTNMAHMNVDNPWALQTPAHGDAIIFCCGTRTMKKHELILHENWDYPNQGP